jgi:hypothetical protein
MTLDEIMEKEKFNEVEKALVKHPMLSQPDRIKIISDIKTAKSNERQSKIIGTLTYVLIVIALAELLSKAHPYLSTIHPALTIVLMFLTLLWVGWLTEFEA